jgi:hypothetical protein
MEIMPVKMNEIITGPTLAAIDGGSDLLFASRPPGCWLAAPGDY